MLTDKLEQLRALRASLRELRKAGASLTATGVAVTVPESGPDGEVFPSPVALDPQATLLLLAAVAAESSKILKTADQAAAAAEAGLKNEAREAVQDERARLDLIEDEIDGP